MEGRNGLDYVDVSDDQLTLTAVFLGKLPPEFQPGAAGMAAHLAIEGGRRVTGIQITAVTPVVDPDPEKDDVLVIKLDQYGDFSTYTLRLVNVENIDPRYDHADFSFKVKCPSDLDCAPGCACAPDVPAEPEINYLAKDYASFRQLILDRLAVVMPEWSETHAADIGIMLVELLAYTGDYLSYYQDAVATEAYLNTARQRISVRRLVRLVDYYLHQGCNARAFVCVAVAVDQKLAAGAAFITGLNQALSATQTLLTWDALSGVPSTDYEVFEPMAAGEIQLDAAHSEIHFYTWGLKECCLDLGSTSATLLDTWNADGSRQLNLHAGDILIFEEVIGPGTGLPADADPKRRQAVRLINVDATGQDPVFKDQKSGKPTPYVNIEWAPEDALQFTFCISVIGPAPACNYLENVSVARGNVILVDCGRTQPPEDLGSVPGLTTSAKCECAGEPGDVRTVPGRVCPVLKKTPLTYRQALPADDPAHSVWTAASNLLAQDVRQALPQLWLTSSPAEPWQVRYDLIESEPGEWNFVVEIDDDGLAHLRFGDGTLGAQPPAGMTLSAKYRIGNGTAGNVGADSISRAVGSGLDGFVTVRNPLSAVGGTEAEPIAEAKLFAPHDFRTQIKRAITADDYAALAGSNPKIQRAAASLNWTGSWYEADVAVDPLGTEAAPSGLLEGIEHYLEQFRRVGHDLEVLPARYVPLDLELEVCALPDYERAHVKKALLDVFSDRILPGGKKGFFHPDNLTFGQGVYLSKIIAAAQAVTGVECVTVTKFQRLFESPNFEIENGILPLATSEIAELDNDPNYPERGKLVITMRGGS
jgi:hypothetical protein